VNRTGFRCGRLLRVRTNEARMSGPRASGSRTCKPSFALLRHEVAPRADKSIRVHERHDNRQERSPPDAFPLVARTSDPRPLGYEPTSRRLQSPPTSQPRRSRLIARPSHRTASHRIAAVTQRFVPKSVHKTARSTCSLGERSVRRCWWPMRWRCAVRAATARPTSCWARQANPIRSKLTLS
jgi:hypothetical protein